MNKETREKKIQEIIERNKKSPFAKQEIPWEDSLTAMDVCKIPLNLLVYNKLNGRIMSRVQSLEKQNLEINADSPEGKLLIEKLLWDSKPARNEKTKASLGKNGQEKVGIITRDGIIIDGNRRAMLLNKISGIDYFKAIVLPATLSENPLAIEKLETTYQMGEDEKLGYNPTEKYLKTKQLYKRLSKSDEIDINNFNKEAIKKISEWMSESDNEIEKYLHTMTIMDDYLDFCGYNGMYTQLDKREDQFLSLTKWLNTFYGESSKRGFDGYRDSDVANLATTAFDYIRVRENYDGKEFRNLAEGNRENHFFGNRDIWESFFNTHCENISKLPQEPNIDFDSDDMLSHLNSRDKEYYNSSIDTQGDSFFIQNIKEHVRKLGHKKAADKPEVLLKRAIQTFSAINKHHKSFSNPKSQKLVNELSKMVFCAVENKSIENSLTQIIELMRSIDINSINNLDNSEKDKINIKVEELRKVVFEISKRV